MLLLLSLQPSMCMCGELGRHPGQAMPAVNGVYLLPAHLPACCTPTSVYTLPSYLHPCKQWLERAREALKREVCDIQQQHGQLSAGLTSAVAAAAAAPASPQKALAAQVLSGLQSSMQHEVGQELRALQLADSLLGSVASQFRSSPPRPAASAAAAAGGACSAAAAAAAVTHGGGDGGGGEAAAAVGQSSGVLGAGASVCKAPCAQAGDGSPSAGSWTIPAVPAGSQAAYPAAPTSQQVVAAAADGALAQLHQLAGGQAQLAQAAALAAGGGSSLRQTFGQMQQMLKSVCQLLQQDEPERQQQQPQRASEPGVTAGWGSRGAGCST